MLDPRDILVLVSISDWPLTIYLKFQWVGAIFDQYNQKYLKITKVSFEMCLSEAIVGKQHNKF